MPHLVVGGHICTFLIWSDLVGGVCPAYTDTTEDPQTASDCIHLGGRLGNGEDRQRPYIIDALLYITYVMRIWAAAIPADRWHCSLWP